MPFTQHEEIIAMACITHCLKDSTQNLDLMDEALSSYTFQSWGEHFKFKDWHAIEDPFTTSLTDFVVQLCQERRLQPPNLNTMYNDREYNINPASHNPDDGLRAGFNPCLMVVYLDLMGLFPPVRHLHQPSSVHQLNALHIAARAGNMRSLDILLDQDPYLPLSTILNGRDSTNRTPLLVACVYGRTAVVQRLLRCPSIDVHVGNTDRRNELRWSRDYGDLSFIEELLNYPTRSLPPVDPHTTKEEDWNPFHYAAADGHFEISQLLLAHPSNSQLDLNVADRLGRTALHMASAGHFDIVRTLLDHPSHLQVDVKDNAGRTPLHYASVTGHINIVKELLKHGAALNARTGDGKTALMLVSQAKWDSGRRIESKRVVRLYLLSLPGVDLEGYESEPDP